MRKGKARQAKIRKGKARQAKQRQAKVKPVSLGQVRVTKGQANVENRAGKAKREKRQGR